jgi:lipoprotein-anchoring transpeptidase ErfK/SrfK
MMPKADNGQSVSIEPKVDAFNFNPKKESRIKKIFFTEIDFSKKKTEKTNKKSVAVPAVKPLEPELKAAAEKIAKPKSKKKSVAKVARPFYKKILIGSAKILFFGSAGTSLLFSGAVFAYQNQYQNKAFFGTRILGENVAGKTKEEIQAVLEKKVSAITLSFAVDGQTFAVKPEEAGVKFQIGDSAGKAIEKGKRGVWYEQYLTSFDSILYRVSPAVANLVRKDFQENLNIDYQINDEKLTLFTQNLSDRFNVQSQNAGLVMQGTEVQVIPAVAGRKIVADSVKLQIAEAIKMGKSDQISIDVAQVNPNIIETDTKESIAAAKSILSLPVAYHYNGQNFSPDKATVATWIIFNTVDAGGKQKLVPAVDAKSVYSYVYSLASKINVPAVNKKVTVKNGVEQVVDQEGKDGLAVDVDKASVNTASALSSGKGVSMELPTYTVKPKTSVNNVFVANWDKYIDVNISTQRMCAYLAGGVQVNCWAITTGRNGWNTPIGTFLIQRKAYVTSMPNPPSPYPLKNIHYVSYFTSQGHAIHEAWWRSSFGGQDYTWNGSHGCVNAPISVAQFIYDWAPIGTPVITHY